MVNTRKITALLTLISIFSMEIHAKKNKQHLDLALPATDSKKQKSRMRKSTGTKEKRISSYRDMNYNQLLTAKNKLVADNNTVSAIKYLDQLIKLCDPEDVATIGNHLLEIADLIFNDGNYHKAAQRYAEFALLHPGSDKIEYALYKAIVSSFNCTLSYDRDQTKTEETLALAESFLKQDHFTVHAQEVQTIAHQCIAKLVESEVSVCQYHLKRGRIKSAEKRMSLLRTTWLPKYRELEPQLLALETNIAEQKNMLIQKAEKNLLVAQNKQAKRMTERF
jgi:outer membrane assembly lipoprotein YfiO